MTTAVWDPNGPFTSLAESGFHQMESSWHPLWLLQAGTAWTAPI